MNSFVQFVGILIKFEREFKKCFVRNVEQMWQTANSAHHAASWYREGYVCTVNPVEMK